MVLARGLLGDQKGTPKSPAPAQEDLSLKTGECLSGDPYRCDVPRARQDGDVYLELRTHKDQLVPVPEPCPGARRPQRSDILKAIASSS
jgi:hypothetical protein